MMLLILLCHVLAFFCFVFAALGVPSRFNLIAVGLACWMLSLLVTRAG
jgi:hypothetical protein